MKDEFPEFVEENADSIPPQIIQVIDRMFGGERPDSREFEWRNVMMPISGAQSELMGIPNARKAIEDCLNEGFALLQMFRIKEGIVYWQGARVRKSEGEP